MPIFSDSPKTSDKNRPGADSFPAGQPQDTQQVELRDFSDDMDLDALGALLGSGDSFGNVQEEQQSENQSKKPKDKEMKKKKERKGSGSLFGALAGGFKKKKQPQDELPTGGEDISGFDFAYKPYTEEDMAEHHAADSGLTESSFEGQSPFGQSSPFEGPSPFEQSSPFEGTSPFEQSSPFEGTSPFEQSSPFEGTSPFEQSSPFEAGASESAAPSAFSADDSGMPETFPDETNEPSESPLPEGAETRADKKQSGLKDSFAALFAAIAERFKGKKEKGGVPLSVGEEVTANSRDDPNYISDTVSLVDMNDSPEEAPENQPPLNNPWEENPIQPPPPDNLPEDSAPLPPMEKQPEEASDAEPLAPPLSAERAEPSRTYNIMRAVRARIRQLGRRLPSFKPKVYTIPESTYEPIDDNIKSPSLMADVEEYIRQKSYLGPVELEYDEMRDYIRSVDTEVQLSPQDVRTPRNLEEVHAAENELFALIDQISAQNEQQRRQIGVYAARPEEDPYNYRGINDARQNYTDIEDSSFSMQPRVSFESEQKIDPNRSAIEQEYYHRLRETEAQKQVFGEGFENDFDDEWGSGSNVSGLDNAFADDFDHDPLGGFNALGGQGVADVSGGGLEDDFENDCDDDWDSGQRVSDAPRAAARSRNRSGSRYDDFEDDLGDELAEDFDRHFASPRVSARPDERKPKRVAVRRRGGI